MGKRSTARASQNDAGHGSRFEQQFARIAGLAASMFGVPIALITLVERDCISVKAQGGSDSDAAPELTAFSSYTIQSGGPLIVPDTLADDRFCSHPTVVGSPSVRFVDLR